MKTIHDENGKNTTPATSTDFHPKWVQMDLFRWAGITDESQEQTNSIEDVILESVGELFGKSKFFDDSAVGFAVRNGQ